MQARRHARLALIRELKPRDRKVLHLYYFHELGLKEIGERLGVGEARVSQIHKQAITELKRVVALHGLSRRAR